MRKRQQVGALLCCSAEEQCSQWLCAAGRVFLFVLHAAVVSTSAALKQPMASHSCVGLAGRACAAFCPAGDKVPLPPCIRVGESGSCEVTLEIEDKQQHATIAKITADAVKVHITGSAGHDSAQQEVLALMAKTLTLRPTQLTMLRGSGANKRVMVVEMLTTRQVYARLRGIPMPQRRQDQPGHRKPKPWHHGL